MRSEMQCQPKCSTIASGLQAPALLDLNPITRSSFKVRLINRTARNSLGAKATEGAAKSRQTIVVWYSYLTEGSVLFFLIAVPKSHIPQVRRKDPIFCMNLDSQPRLFCDPL